ncbi:HAD family phosphatase [Salicibibacter cibarius]|uniref:HAD family phosphatase n=1 Tax=Salicibibacter cibarius TaxID=2743000 RepID=A0A7T7CAU0_9BACI|nr:Cof-type HAD-IIB family hydrolase [Salicibibacter cibarius]QQK75198.1 HAD family phosphatase [Salicibibacter cibarius]
MKLVAIDMDGTLLHTEKEISDHTVSAIQRLQKEGHAFIIATGRTLQDAKKIVSTAGIPADGYICANGAMIADRNGHILTEKHLGLHVATDIASWLHERQFYFHLATSEGIYTTDGTYQFFLDDLHAYAREKNDGGKMAAIIRDQADRQLNNMGVKMLPSPEDIPGYDFTAYKFLVLSLFPQKLQTIRTAWEPNPSIALTSSGRDNIELMPFDAEKGSGLTLMAKQLGVTPANTVAIGDNYNDLSMFKTAGLSIAMGNAEAEVKQYADTETADNDDNGVAKAIETHIFGIRQ